MAVPGLRKVVLTSELVHAEMGREVNPPIRTVAAAAVLTNPWAGQGFVEDLDPLIADVAPRIAEVLVPAIMTEIGGANNVEAFGKAAVVGLDGEIEHASGLIHTLRFGNQFRKAAEGTSYLSFTNKRAAPGALITIPMTHKTDTSKRSHYITFDFVIPDAPAADEIVVALGACSAGRPFPRIGDRHKDMAVGAV